MVSQAARLPRACHLYNYWAEQIAHPPAARASLEQRVLQGGLQEATQACLVPEWLLVEEAGQCQYATDLQLRGSPANNVHMRDNKGHSIAPIDLANGLHDSYCMSIVPGEWPPR